MLDFLALGGLPSLFSFARQRTAGSRDIKAFSCAAASDSETGYRPIFARQNAAYTVAFSLDRQDAAYTVAFSAI